ncbi:MAG: hypothetical protein F6K00_30980 [Leptolyngbya sp. SIOISBB]|nr:hypothetical protein [Leptolyngbya sp. SIOISBB]
MKSIELDNRWAIAKAAKYRSSDRVTLLNSLNRQAFGRLADVVIVELAVAIADR